MSFIVAAGDVISFAEYTDVLQRDQRFFVANELVIPANSGFATIPDFVEDLLIQSTNRILLKFKSSAWWISYNAYTGTPVNSIADLPNLNANRIDPGNQRGRRPQFTDLCVYYAMAQYLLPLVSQFDLDSADLAKMEYYDKKFNDLFSELLHMADWYDADGSGTVDRSEIAYSYQQTRRTRRRQQIVRVR
jgi:hypothetical protein